MGVLLHQIKVILMKIQTRSLMINIQLLSPLTTISIEIIPNHYTPPRVNTEIGINSHWIRLLKALDLILFESLLHNTFVFIIQVMSLDISLRFSIYNWFSLTCR